jgi:hypothetical protein
VINRENQEAGAVGKNPSDPYHQATGEMQGQRFFNLEDLGWCSIGQLPLLT